MYIHKKWFIQNALSKYKLHVIEIFFENVNIKNVSYNESQQEDALNFLKWKCLLIKKHIILVQHVVLKH